MITFLRLFLLALAALATELESGEEILRNSQLPASGVSELRRHFELSSSMNSGLYTGKAGGEDAFFKLIDGNASSSPEARESFLRELSFTKLLSDAGVGPKFLGVAVIKKKFAIVTREIPGVNLRFGSDFFSNLGSFTPKSVSSLQKILAFMKAHPDLDFYDFQSRMSSRTGEVLVIDPGLFRISPYPNPDGTKQLQSWAALAAEAVRFRESPQVAGAARPLYEKLLAQARNKEAAGRPLAVLLNYYTRAAQENVLTGFDAVNFASRIFQARERDPAGLKEKAMKKLGLVDARGVARPLEDPRFQRLVLDLDRGLREGNSPLLNNGSFSRWWSQEVSGATRRLEEAGRQGGSALGRSCGWLYSLLRR